MREPLKRRGKEEAEDSQRFRFSSRFASVTGFHKKGCQQGVGCKLEERGRWR